MVEAQLVVHQLRTARSGAPIRRANVAKEVRIEMDPFHLDQRGQPLPERVRRAIHANRLDRQMRRRGLAARSKLSRPGRTSRICPASQSEKPRIARSAPWRRGRHAKPKTRSAEKVDQQLTAEQQRDHRPGVMALLDQVAFALGAEPPDRMRDDREAEADQRPGERRHRHGDDAIGHGQGDPAQPGRQHPAAGLNCQSKQARRRTTTGRRPCSRWRNAPPRRARPKPQRRIGRVADEEARQADRRGRKQPCRHAGLPPLPEQQPARSRIMLIPPSLMAASTCPESMRSTYATRRRRAMARVPAGTAWSPVPGPASPRVEGLQERHGRAAPRDPQIDWIQSSPVRGCAA